MAASVRQALDEAEDCLYAEMPRAALALCRVVLADYPRCLRAYTLAAAALWSQGDNVAASRSLRMVLQSNPEDLMARFLLAMALEDDHLDEAIAEMDIAYSQDTADPEILQAWTRMVRVRDRVTRRPAPGRDALARLYARGGLWERALAESADLVVTRGARLDLQLLLVEAEWRTGLWEQAAVVCEDLLLNNPHSVKANLILAAIRAASGAAPVAESLFRRAFELDPELRLARRLFGEEGALKAAPGGEGRLRLNDDAELTGDEDKLAEVSPLQSPLPLDAGDKPAEAKSRQGLLRRLAEPSRMAGEPGMPDRRESVG
jgi:tetratricopeptide (TPR) repeat protein